MTPKVNGEPDFAHGFGNNGSVLFATQTKPRKFLIIYHLALSFCFCLITDFTLKFYEWSCTKCWFWTMWFGLKVPVHHYYSLWTTYSNRSVFVYSLIHAWEALYKCKAVHKFWFNCFLEMCWFWSTSWGLLQSFLETGLTPVFLASPQAGTS